MSDADILQRAQALRPALAEQEGKKGKDNPHLAEVFALVREVARRQLEMRHFDCQIIGGMVLHQGQIAEMKTGEGKTLVATLATCYNSLCGLKSYVVTVNNYLAGRDAEWMRPIYEGLGLSVGVIRSEQSMQEKRAAYACDVIYATNNELGFDWLRDHMVLTSEQQMQAPLDYAIVDEVDSILIDEARTPLIISGPSEDSSALYKEIGKVIPKLKQQMREESQEEPLGEDEVGDYWVDEKNRQVELTDRGHEHVEEMLQKAGTLNGDSLYSASQLRLLHYVESSLRAYTLYKRNVHYIVEEGEVVLIDEHTGRTLPGRRLSQGVHQALECREGLDIRQETQTLASTTFQNFFRLYGKLAGMTGTALTEAAEFMEIYGLSVIEIPTAKPMNREDANDVIFQTREEKYEAVLEEIEHIRAGKAPCLVGTASVEDSEYLSSMLRKNGVAHQVLNAKNHAQEAEIVAQAGQPGAVTIATNMAGRGTDIVLGGNLEAELSKLLPEERHSSARSEEIRKHWQERHDAVVAAGGLHILGTDRHESRRIDNQLRGRAGRQGDPGASRFFLSLEDDLIRIFASDRVRSMMRTMGMQRGEAIEHGILTRSIARAQKKVEERNFDQRKQILEYDNVSNEQRHIVYNQRDDILHSEDLGDWIDETRADILQSVVESHAPSGTSRAQWNMPALVLALKSEFGLTIGEDEFADIKHNTGALEIVLARADALYEAKRERLGETMRAVERQILLQVLDRQWKEHLASMDHLRSSVHLRAYAQKNPRQEYKREAFEMFQQMLESVRQMVTGILMRVEVATGDADRLRDEQRGSAQASLAAARAERPELDRGLPSDPAQAGAVATRARAPAPAPTGPLRRSEAKVGRNAPCPCGSGRKYKQCHGR